MGNNCSFLIIDDEPFALEYIHETLEEAKSDNKFFSNYEIMTTSTYHNFIALVKEHRPNVIFLDIQMPLKTGIEIARYIRDNYLELGYEDKNMPILSYITAYENKYHWQSKELGIVDFISKPVNVERLQQTLTLIENKYFPFIKKSQNKENSTPVCKFEDITICMKDVLFFQAESKNISVYYLKDNRIYTCVMNSTLQKIQEDFPDLLKTHRAYLLNTSYYKVLHEKGDETYIELDTEELRTIPVARRMKQEVKKRLNITKEKE